MNARTTYFKNVIVPGLILSGVTGVFTGAFIFFFKWGADFFAGLSGDIYAFVRDNLAYLPLMILGLAALAVLTAFFIKKEPVVSGGGIPTAEGILRGLITFKWLRALIGMVINGYAAFFAGLPLGNEGPSVLIGTSIGRGTGKLFKNSPAWDRYVMTGGAAAGFATATGSPATGVVFALEEVHKRFSPMILMVALSSVVFASFTSGALAEIFGRSADMFAFSALPALPLKYFWQGLIAGAGAGIMAVLFIKGFVFLYSLLGEKIRKVPTEVKLIAVFILVGAAGLILPAAAGSGHSVIEQVNGRGMVWYMIAVLLVVKVVLILLCGGAGATGGLFIPVLTVGALTGGLIAELCLVLNMPAEYYSAVVLMTVSAFLGATLRAPITALLFFIEALGGINNVPFAVLALFVSYLIAEITGVKPLYETVLERKLRILNKDKVPRIIELEAVVQKGAFVIGKATRDIFWPPSCLVTSVVRAGSDRISGARMDKDGEKVIREGDILSLRVQTYDQNETFKLIRDLVGADPVPSGELEKKT